MNLITSVLVVALRENDSHVTLRDCCHSAAPSEDCFKSGLRPKIWSPEGGEITMNKDSLAFY